MYASCDVNVECCIVTAILICMAMFEHECGVLAANCGSLSCSMVQLNALCWVESLCAAHHLTQNSLCSLQLQSSAVLRPATFS